MQYRLRTLLILTTICATWVAWWSYKADKQRRAVATLAKSGALVMYTRHGILFDNVNGLENHALIDFFDTASFLWLTRYPSDADIAALQSLDSLRNVSTLYVRRRRAEDAVRLHEALPNCSFLLVDIMHVDPRQWDHSPH